MGWALIYISPVYPVMTTP
ncbi:unnamed protein product [Spirodela intermedia]|uniref:Uncharacterized protein n=1 Tax=Spirodela intermedia TaxID=51605 RepID=A0A7I8JEF3_SPIIN|nr:unnamed protein product [Spirodela intermedia]CAA6668145.1 unnamed protein product [Spirodela intermedia]